MRTVILAIALASIPSLALADAVPPNPTDCPDGTQAQFCHGPETCRVLSCTTDADCAGGGSCEERQLCVNTHCCGGMACAGILDGSMGENVTAARTSCGGGGACDVGTCQAVNVCVGGDTGGGSDGGCSVHPAAGGGAFALALIGLGLALTVRRLRR